MEHVKNLKNQRTDGRMRGRRYTVDWLRPDCQMTFYVDLYPLLLGVFCVFGDEGGAIIDRSSRVVSSPSGVSTASQRIPNIGLPLWLELK